MNLRPGEIWLADLGLAAKTRPVVIVSREDPEAPRALAIYVPLTTQNRKSSYEVAIPKLAFLNRPPRTIFATSSSNFTSHQINLSAANCSTCLARIFCSRPSPNSSHYQALPVLSTLH